jgi:4-hydroxy-tetrahydrodipicolinate synthase
MTHHIRGVLPVIHTPFIDGNQIDRESLQREVDWAFELGSDGVVAAMVSEILRLTYDERIQLTDDLVEMTAGRGVVVSSVGAESIKQSQHLARSAQQSGCHALMAIPPICTSLPDDELWRYFCEIAECVDLPLIVQDASSYVGGALSIALFVRLLDRFGADKILFKPEAAPIGPNLSALRDQSNGRAIVFDGSGGVLLIDAYRRGIAGTMPGTDLLDGIITLWRALQAGDDTTAYRVYFPICAIVNLQLQAGLDGFLAIEKYLMVKRGIFADDSRRPPFSWELDQETRAEVDRLFGMLMQAIDH